MTGLFDRIRPPEAFPSGMTKEQLAQQLSGMGLPPRAWLLVHSSLRALGDIMGGAKTVIDALCGCLDGGTLFLPVCTYETEDGGRGVFDPFAEPSCTGLLGEALLKYAPGSVRTCHPDYSMAVWGAGARTAAERELYSSSPCSRVGCIGMLADNGGYILLAGTGMESCLPVFASGEWLEPEKWLSPPELRYTVDNTPGGNGRVMMRSVSRYSPYAMRAAGYFGKLAEPLAELGAARACRFGNADCLLIKCASLVSVASNLMFRCPELFADGGRVPRRLLKEVRRDEDTLARRRLSDD